MLTSILCFEGEKILQNDEFTRDRSKAGPQINKALNVSVIEGRETNRDDFTISWAGLL